MKHGSATRRRLNGNVGKGLFGLVGLVVVVCLCMFGMERGYHVGGRLPETRRMTVSFPNSGETTETIVPPENRKDESEIRYASFGTSNTWGSLLEDRDNEAYAWLLSDTDHERAKNYGIGAHGPDYPSQCLSTMIGDEEYDVIVLEFFMHAHEGLTELALRLRERFPDAVIVFVRLWYLGQITQWFGEKFVNVNQWARARGYTARPYIHDKEFQEILLKDENSMKWRMWYGSHHQKEIQESTADMVGGYLVELPFNEWPGGPDGWLTYADKYIAMDSFHLSTAGHALIAEKIKQVVRRVGVPKTRRVTPFPRIDQCLNWLQTGIVGEELTFSPNASVVRMPNANKFGLEFNFEQGGENGSWISITNKSDREMKISIGYMTTGPAPSKYPKVVATLGPGHANSEIVLNPEASEIYKEKEVHIPRSQSLGVINPLEEEKIYFKPLETTEWPFRLVQVMIVPLSDEEAGNKV